MEDGGGLQRVFANTPAFLLDGFDDLVLCEDSIYE